MKVSNENAFSVPAESFAVSASESGYVLNYSADGLSWTAYDKETPAGEVLMVCGFPKGVTYKLVGNSGDVYVQY